MLFTPPVMRASLLGRIIPQLHTTTREDLVHLYFDRHLHTVASRRLIHLDLACERQERQRAKEGRESIGCNENESMLHQGTHIQENISRSFAQTKDH